MSHKWENKNNFWKYLPTTNFWNFEYLVIWSKYLSWTYVKARFIAISCKIIMDIKFLGYHYMRYNFLDHYWPYCKFSCKLLVLYHCTFNSPICFKSQDFFSSSTHGFGVQNLHYTHTFSRCLGKFIFHFRIMYIFSDILELFCCMHCAVV